MLIGSVGIPVGAPTWTVFLGPGRLQNIVVRIDPAASTYRASGEVYIGAAQNAYMQTGEALRVDAITAIPTDPPIPVDAALEGGFLLTLQGSEAGSIARAVNLGYSSGAISLDLTDTLQLGVILEADLDAYLNAQLYEIELCEFIWPLEHWEMSKAESYSLPISLSFSGGAAGITIGPISGGAIPVEDIETTLQRFRPESHCKEFEEVIEELCKRGILPPEVCDEAAPDGTDSPQPEEEQPGTKGATYACAICKCSGDPECGGGRIHTIWMGRTECNRENKKEAQRLCNHDSTFLSICDLDQNRPDGKKCSVHHHDFVCSERETEDKCNNRRQSIEQLVSCPAQTVTMGGAKCRTQYGAVGKYCYSGAKNWWFKEKVVNGSPNTCDTSPIDQTTTPFQSTSGCVSDKIFNFNGPPSTRAPCKDVTNQTVFAGPTEADVEKCKYKNKQIIEVTVNKGSSPKSGKVITSSAGESTDCEWT